MFDLDFRDIDARVGGRALMEGDKTLIVPLLVHVAGVNVNAFTYDGINRQYPSNRASDVFREAISMVD